MGLAPPIYAGGPTMVAPGVTFPGLLVVECCFLLKFHLLVYLVPPGVTLSCLAGTPLVDLSLAAHDKGCVDTLLCSKWTVLT